MTYEEHFQCLSISECKSSVSVLSYIRSRSLNYYLIWFDRDEAVFCGLMFMFMFIRMFIWFCAWTWFCWRVRHIRHTCFFFLPQTQHEPWLPSATEQKRINGTTFLLNECYLISRNCPLCVQIKWVLRSVRESNNKNSSHESAQRNASF